MIAKIPAVLIVASLFLVLGGFFLLQKEKTDTPVEYFETESETQIQTEPETETKTSSFPPGSSQETENKEPEKQESFVFGAEVFIGEQENNEEAENIEESQENNALLNETEQTPFENLPEPSLGPEPVLSLSYPGEIPVNKEIEVDFSASYLKEATYDVKISIEQGGTLSEIYNQKEQKWQSSFNYLTSAFSGNSYEGRFQLKIREDKNNFRGQAEILARIRETGKSSYLEFKDIIVIGEPDPEPEQQAQVPEEQAGTEDNNEQANNEQQNNEQGNNGQEDPEVGQGENLLENPYFDNDWEGTELSGNPVGWVWGKRGGLEMESPPLVSGKRSFYHEPYSSYQDLTQLGKALLVDKTYYAEVWVKDTGRVKLGIEHSGGTEWLSSYYTNFDNSPWTKMVFSVQVTQETNNGGIRIRMTRGKSTGERLVIGAVWFGNSEPPENWLNN